MSHAAAPQRRPDPPAARVDGFGYLCLTCAAVIRIDSPRMSPGAPFMKHPFAALSSEIVAQSPLRAAITAAYRRPEPESVIPLLEQAAVTPAEAKRIDALARSLVSRLRGKTHSSGVEGLIHEYSLSSQEGVA